MLWGLVLLRLGVTRGFGAGLRKTLSASTGNRLTAFLSGAAVTTFLQSSTATIMIIATFAGQGMIGPAGGLAMILGADVGTTLVAQLLSFDLSWLAPVLMIAGYVFFTSESAGRMKNIGRILVGLALMLFALKWISTAAAPLKQSEALPLILAPLDHDPILAVIVAALVTWMAHSSLAVVLLIVSLGSSGVIPLHLCLMMVLGANLGGTAAPFMATLRESPAAKRIPVGNMIIRFVGVVAAAPFLKEIQPLLADLAPEPARQIVNFHTAFNLALALVFLPMVDVVAGLARRLVKDRPDADDPSKPRYLDYSALDTPSIALTSATRETLRMADMVEKMLMDSLRAFKTDDESVIAHISRQDDTIDKIFGAIKTYMARLTQEFMDPEEAQRSVQILMFATNLEYCGDVIDKNLLPMASKKIRGQKSFSKEGLREIEQIHTLVVESLRLAQSVFVSGDIDLARKLIEDKERLREAESQASSAHIDRLRSGVPETIATSGLHMDIIRDLRRINTYMCTVAYPILEQKGQIRSSRLKPAAGEGDKGSAAESAERYSGHWLE